MFKATKSSRLQSPRPSSVKLSMTQPKKRRPTAFTEGKIYLATVVGFVACQFLTSTWLPALGLLTLDHLYGSIADFLAPYLLLPLCLVLTVIVVKRNLFAGLLAGLGSLMIDLFFFIHYNMLLAWCGLIIIGIGVLLNYVVYKRGQEKPDIVAAVSQSERRHMKIIYTGIYIVCFVLSAYVLYPLLSHAHLVIPYFGGDVPNATATIPTLIVLVVYLLYKNMRHTT